MVAGVDTVARMSTSYFLFPNQPNQLLLVFICTANTEKYWLITIQHCNKAMVSQELKTCTEQLVRIFTTIFNLTVQHTTVPVFYHQTLLQCLNDHLLSVYMLWTDISLHPGQTTPQRTSQQCHSPDWPSMLIVDFSSVIKLNRVARWCSG